MGQCPTFDRLCPTFDVDPYTNIFLTIILQLCNNHLFLVYLVTLIVNSCDLFEGLETPLRGQNGSKYCRPRWGAYSAPDPHVIQARSAQVCSLHSHQNMIFSAF